MDYQEKLNFMWQKCIDANPDIVALKLGCVAILRDIAIAVWGL